MKLSLGSALRLQLVVPPQILHQKRTRQRWEARLLIPSIQNEIRKTSFETRRLDQRCSRFITGSAMSPFLHKGHVAKIDITLWAQNVLRSKHRATHRLIVLDR